MFRDDSSELLSLDKTERHTATGIQLPVHVFYGRRRRQAMRPRYIRVHPRLPQSADKWPAGRTGPTIGIRLRRDDGQRRTLPIFCGKLKILRFMAKTEGREQNSDGIVRHLPRLNGESTFSKTGGV